MTMSHLVTIRTQTVTSSSTAIVINTGYLKTWSGLLKLLEVALGVVCVSIIGNRFATYGAYGTIEELLFLLITTTFMISSFILLVSCLASLSTSSIIAKTIFELLFHAIAFGLYLAASLTFLVHVSNMRRSKEYEVLMAAAICGLVNAALYLLSTIVALRTYRGIWSRYRRARCWKFVFSRSFLNRTYLPFVSFIRCFGQRSVRRVLSNSWLCTKLFFHTIYRIFYIFYARISYCTRYCYQIFVTFF